MKLEYNLINSLVESELKIINSRENYNSENVRYSYYKLADYINIPKAKKWIKENINFGIHNDPLNNSFNFIETIDTLNNTKLYNVGITGVFVLGQPIMYYDNLGTDVVGSLLYQVCWINNSGLFNFGIQTDHITNGIFEEESVPVNNIIFFAERNATVPMKYKDLNTLETIDLPSITVEAGKIYFFKTDHKNKDIVLDEVITVPTVTIEE